MRYAQSKYLKVKDKVLLNKLGILNKPEFLTGKLFTAVIFIGRIE